MYLGSIPENPTPPGAVVAAIATSDQATLRAARWSCGGSCKGTVAILPGRAEFIEKYFEVVSELLDRNFDVAVLDWRGQGLSDRLLASRDKSHIGHFKVYALDLEAFRSQILEPFCRPPFFGLGHSMGGAILLAQARAGRSPFQRLVLSAPMIDLYGLRFPQGSRALARTLAMLGFGKAFIPGGGSNPYLASKFEDNVLTSDPVRFNRVAAIVSTHPEVAVADPTIAWVNAAFRLMARFENIEFARRTLTPTLIIAAGADRLVDTKAAETFGSRLKAGKVVTIPYARHEILIERDPIREQFWAAFDAFIPGAGGLAARDADLAAAAKSG
ncbi:alpha/beta fold hydrolase [Methylocapsa palsarum]|uniref:Lysophospholipase n=1 Tax=Methylocapsa palsarum TaxID=1612308 RepID=A0A1I4AK39_9HYPH|nr:alpha/beta hydrolase [Methylocapsa palsarum]SFK56109.1 lysophospholipase [Methylocapsa palsarum]